MTTESPSLPADPASRARHEEWNAALAAASATQPTREAPEPDTRALELINATHAGKDADGRRFYDTNATFRETVERLRVDALSGRFDEREARRAIAAALGKPLPPEVEPTSPQGTPEQRAADAAYVAPDQVPPEAWQGFDSVPLPDGVSLDPQALSPYLAAARAAGASQSQVAKFVQGMAAADIAAPEHAIAEYVEPSGLEASEWSGYQPIGLPPGFMVDRSEFAAKLRLARAAGFSQGQVAEGLAAYLDQLRADA